MGTRLNDEYFERVSRGLIPGKGRLSKFGRNSAVGATEVVISALGIYGLPTVADTVTSTSTDVGDAPAGAGARVLKVWGVDANWNAIEEVVAMGDTTTKEFLRVFRARVLEAGTITATLGGNLGDITIAQTGGTNMVAIPEHEGSTLCACYSVPKGYQALIWEASTTVGGGKDSVNRLKIRDNNMVNAPFTTEGIRDNFENQVGREFVLPSVVSSGNDIVFTSVSSASGTAVSGAFMMELIKVGE